MKSSPFLVALMGLCAAVAARAETPLERGAYLARTIAACGNCHTPKNPDWSEQTGKLLAGGFVIDLPPFTAVAPNITPDKETGIGRWTDAEIARAIREGVRPNGSIIGPPMPVEFYSKISDRDAAAIVAYLRSVPAVRNAVGKSVYRIKLPDTWGNAAGDPDPPPQNDRLAYGAYLAGPVGHCLECHTPMRANGAGRDMAQAGAGGPPVPGPHGMVPPPNITPDKETGIGQWTDGEIRRAITQGISRDGRKLSPPMAFAYYARMTPRDLDAVVAYLRSLKPMRTAP